MLTILLKAKKAEEEGKNILKSESTHISTGTTYFQQFGYRVSCFCVRWKDVHTRAAAKFSRDEEGITYVELCRGRNKLVQTPKQAQNVLRYWKKKRLLFTYGRTKPQQYFLSEDVAEYSFLKSTHFDTTAVHGRKTDIYSGYARPDEPVLPKATGTSTTAVAAASAAAANTFLQCLALAKFQPLAIHNLCFHIQLSNPRREHDNPYDRIKTCAITEKHNRTKRYEYRRGKAHITFRAFPNNSVDVYVACSGDPFPLDTQEDVTSLFCFVGAVHDTLRVWLSDISNTITPPVHDWQLVRADLNRDVRVTPLLYFAMPKMQLRTAEGVFRIYAKTLSDGHLYNRQEKMLPKGAVGSCFTEDAIYELMKNVDTDPQATTIPIAASAAAAENHNNEKELTGND